MEREFSGRSPLPSGPLLIPPEAGEKFHTGRLGTQWKIDGPQTGGRFSVVQFACRISVSISSMRKRIASVLLSQDAY
jgi:hypothetical protein